MGIEKKKIWTIPYIDQPVSFWSTVFKKFGNDIKTVYLPVPEINFGSGRPLQPGKHVYEFLNSNAFPVSVLLNGIVLRRPVEEIFASVNPLLHKCVSQWRIEEVTVANPELARLIKGEFPDLTVVGSTLMDIRSVSQMVYLSGIDTIVPSTSLTRNPEGLLELKHAFSGRIRLMVNESCLTDCSLRTQHFYEMSNPEITFPKSLCEGILKAKPWLRLTGSWILPQHLDLFSGCYDELKLSGRVSLSDPSRYISVLDSYINKKVLMPHEIGGGPASVTIPLGVSDSFYRYTLECDKNCMNCSVCSKYWAENGRSYE